MQCSEVKLKDMNAIQICSYYGHGALYDLLFNALRQRGIDLDVYYFAIKGSKPSTQDDNVLFSDCYSNVDRLFFMHKESKVLRDFYSRVDSQSYNVAHAHSLFSNGYVALDLKRRCGIPYVVAVRNTDVNSFFRIRPWLRRTGIRIMREASQVVFISPAYKKMVLEEFVPNNLRSEISAKSVVVPNGISSLFLEDQPDEPRVADGTIRVIQVGEINANKNQVLTSEACDLLVDGGMDVRLTVIGRTKDARKLKQLKLHPCVEVIDPMSQSALIEAYRNADVFVMPSKHETFGMVYVEALSQGLPIVYTKGQGFDGFFPEGRVGYSTSLIGPEELATRILDAYSIKESAFDICKESALKFSWENAASTYSAIYKKVAYGS